MAKATVESFHCIPQPQESKLKIKTNDSAHNLLTLQEIKDLTNQVLGNDAELIEYSTRPYSEGTLGFLGSHLRLCITARSHNKKQDLSFFVKAIPYEIPSQAEYIIEKGIFYHEAIFYNEVVPLLRKKYRGQSWSATCYKAKKDFIIFEDLSLKGYSTRNKMFNEELIKAGLTSIARMHAASMMAEESLGTSLNKIYPYLFEEKSFCHTGKTKEWLTTGINATVAVAEHLGLDSTSIRKACEQVDEAFKPSANKANVVSHGDLWGNNLMFSNDKSPKCLLVDFQLLRYCPLAHDVAQLLYLCTSRSFRKKREKAMIKHYYKVLCETLETYESNIRPSWTEVIDGMEEQRLSAVITATIYFPTVLMDENLSAKVTSDPKVYHEYYFCDRNDFVIENMKKDSQYRIGITDAITELVELASRMNELPKPC